MKFSVCLPTGFEGVMILEKVARLAHIGVQHCCALMFPTDTVDEMLEQMEWFASAVMRVAAR